LEEEVVEGGKGMVFIMEEEGKMGKKVKEQLLEGK